MRFTSTPRRPRRRLFRHRGARRTSPAGVRSGWCDGVRVRDDWNPDPAGEHPPESARSARTSGSTCRRPVRRGPRCSSSRRTASAIGVSELEPDLYALAVRAEGGHRPAEHAAAHRRRAICSGIRPATSTRPRPRRADLGGVAVIATSHPHMFGAQTSWSRMFGDVPVLVHERRPALGAARGAVHPDLVGRARGAARGDAAHDRRPLPRQRGRALGSRRGALRRHGVPRPVAVAG